MSMLESGVGLFHATKIAALKPILQYGILPMGRAASMCSTLYHLDESSRNVGVQRLKSEEWECVV
eukprot:10553894-Lingulodinium_polyedra.AAC.1